MSQIGKRVVGRYGKRCLVSATEGQRPRNYSSHWCCSCLIFCFKNSHNLSLCLFAILLFFQYFFSFIIFYHHIYLSFYFICIPTYLPMSTYVYLPTYLYQHTYLLMTTYLLPTYVNLPTPTNLHQHTYLPISTHLPTYVYLPTHTNPRQPTIIYLPSYLYQSLNINIELPQTQEPVWVLLLLIGKILMYVIKLFAFI